MTRLALALAAVTLGSACGPAPTNPPPCNPTAVIDWSWQGGSVGGFVDYTNTIQTTCAAAGVGTVEVYANGTPVGVFGCTGGPRSVFLYPGANDVVVEGLDAPSASGGIILYRHEFPIAASGCGSQGTFVAQPAEGRVQLSYAFGPTNACVAGTSYMWIRVGDDVAGVIAADSSAAPTTNNVCAVPAPAGDNPLTFRLAEGSYTLLSIEERVWNPSARRYDVVGRNCAHAPFTVAGGTTTAFGATLVDAAAACP